MCQTVVKDGNEYEVAWSRPDLKPKQMHYCPGCGHGTLEKIMQEVIDEMGIQGKTIGVAPVGCSVFAYDYMNVDMQQAAHGRACAVATGISRVLPDHAVFTIQGDGDLAAIGTAETIHACNRGENIVIFFYNNAIYGMTGGQMAPTTLPGQVTSSSPYGRDVSTAGAPIKIADMIAQLGGVCYVTRVAVDSLPNVKKTKAAMKKAFENSLNKRGTSFVEIVGNCPSGWKLAPVDAHKWWKENMMEAYPLGDIKTEGGLK